ncbi:hypothetical protein PTSG_13160 [Salpingoeca rosetta]|uniref:non-specific serine/threonine protein kinase n=1 Tax=Salpingoeca rosetta (strain ATCC 50818 / BSB-021) TaxID=946362 RepID=F2USV6_SALR5|nr:uncharacterized protein PTSG_13160 [Salpingoeca rosetta]EGD81215.1 hypothetical protein PTSG_13160 [Salpingoeca rosetta]|eukprot:XP_004987749.1 hypothetical protein PTSG_13160 [Salpingoeca rosetta]
MSALIHACKQGDLDLVKRLLLEGDPDKGGAKPNVNEERDEKFGASGLHWTSAFGHEAVVRYLVEQGADVNRAANEGAIPLHIVSQEGYEAVVRYLVEQGADVHQAMNDGRTPLWTASFNGHEAVVRYLAEQGADVHQAKNDGRTPLWTASFNGHEAVVRYLVEQGADVHKAMNDVRVFRCRGNSDIVTLLSHPQPRHYAEMTSIMSDIAERSGTRMAARAKLMFVGEGRAGKTTTLRSLMGKRFQRTQDSTRGATAHDTAVIVNTKDVFSWKATDGRLSEYLRTLRDTALARKTKLAKKMRQRADRAAAEHQQRVRQQQREQQEATCQHTPRGEEQDQGSATDTAKQSPVQPTPSQCTQRTTSASPSSSPSTTSTAKKPSTVPKPRPTPSSASAAYSPSPGDVEKAIREMDLDGALDEAQVTFKVFDLGGQSTFYIFHPFFLTKYAVYLLVFSMEDLLHQDASKRAETWEFMEHWLSSLHLHAKGAPVLIVGTHADKVRSRTLHTQLSRDIHSHLRYNPAFPGVIHNDKHGLWFWPVNNTKSINDPMIQDLRQTISSIALAQEYVSQEVAVPYLHLYDKLNAIARDEKRPLLTFDEVVKIAGTCGLHTREETRACLQFLHLYSMVLYYDHVPGMEDYVILSPQWAVDTMTRVIRNFDLHRDVRDGKARALGPGVWDDLVDRGILHRRLLGVLWKDVRDDMVEPFLQLMMEYGLCAEYSHATMQAGQQQQEQQQQQQQYLVPSNLPMTLKGKETSSVILSTTAAKDAHTYGAYEEKTAYITFSLNDFKKTASVGVEDAQQASFLPEGLFTVVLARVLEGMQSTAAQEPQLSRTHVILFINTTKVELQLVPAVGGIKIKITSDRPRTLLHVLYDIITTAALQRYPDLKANLLLPYNKKKLLLFEDVLHHHKSKQDMWVGDDLVRVSDLSTKYRPLLPVLGLQDKYDAFISYRQRGNTGLVLTLHPKLEHHGLVVFVDANNLEAGVNFKHACLTALQHSVVACPVVAVAAIHQMRSLGHNDTCDNVLLEWMAMLELQQLARQHPDKIRLRRIVPLFVGSGWHDGNHTMSVASASEYDSPEYMKRLAMKLPDVVSKETTAALDEYFTQVLHLRPPQQHKSVREVVLSLFDMDGMMSLQHHADRAADAARMAKHVRMAVAAAKRDIVSFEEWLSSLSLSADARGALAALGVASFEVLRAMKERGRLKEEALTGVPVGAAARLIHAFESGTQAAPAHGDVAADDDDEESCA